MRFKTTFLDTFSTKWPNINTVFNLSRRNTRTKTNKLNEHQNSYSQIVKKCDQKYEVDTESCNSIKFGQQKHRTLLPSID